MTTPRRVSLLRALRLTWKRSDLGKGLEPDESYWVQNEPLVRGRADVDPERDLPPDLVVEVDVSTRSLNRLAIYAAFGVPEVWRHDGEGVRVHVLGEDRSYRECEHGVAFPWLAATDLTSWLEQASRTDLTTWIRGFRGWVRTVLPTS